AAMPDREPKQIDADNVVPLNRERKKKNAKGSTIPLKGLIPGMAVHYARCCHPLPGERIVGIVTTGKGVTVHTIDCETLEGFQSMPERWLDVAWDMEEAGQTHIGRLGVILLNEPGSLGGLSTIIGKNSGNIVNLKVTNRSVDFFEMQVDVEVGNVRHLTNIIAALRATPLITSVERARG
ncbi:MAG: bifunctional (p)ppGpp synthetase/guanosine-3',5'-bis(diphosphate) 3'-pyrophosphohydrolase, partial [Alphaproteobacteria bacterium]|nr:bifunctional (p)ppGpp synthetase/guanosine-3',5'-bis(diphosphate) 3'-pyrophosphohydrolase [Alphaproteobacteria bacterium]